LRGRGCFATPAAFKTWVPGGLSTITHVILIPMTGSE
jgi:hypothetical protein